LFGRTDQSQLTWPGSKAAAATREKNQDGNAQEPLWHCCTASCSRHIRILYGGARVGANKAGKAMGVLSKE
jgi:hypothetical protein